MHMEAFFRFIILYFIFCPPQGTWVKAMVPVTEWVLQIGDEAVEVVKRMETRSGDRVTAHTFKCLEAFYHPDDYAELAQVMLDEKSKPTTQRLGQAPHFAFHICRMIANHENKERFFIMQKGSVFPLRI
eukprot:EG_transcript_3899